jgi:hypothetical protein
MASSESGYQVHVVFDLSAQLPVYLDFVEVATSPPNGGRINLRVPHANIG